MPPSRGLRPAGQLLLSRITRPPLGVSSNVRAISSTSLTARHSARARTVASSSSLPVTGYILHNGRANLSLWPFSSGSSNSKPAEVAPETIPETLAQPVSDAATASSSSSALSSAAPNAQDAASSLAAQAQSTLHDAASTVSSAGASALEPSTASLPEPTFLDNITQIGQMKELGLDYGWGPTSVVEWVVEHIHVYAGTPWFATVILSAVAMRVAMIWPFLKMTDQQARMQKIQPEMARHMKTYQESGAEGDRMAQQIATKQIQLLRHRNGISMGWMFAPVVVQGVFGFGAFKLTRAMAALPVPGFETGGFGWLTDLTIADPTYITPVALWVTMHLLARTTTTDVPASADPAMTKMMKPVGLYVLPTFMFAVCAWQCAALQLTFLIATIFGTAQNLLFRNPKFRQLVGLTPFKNNKVIPIRAEQPASGTGSQGGDGVPSVSSSKQNPFQNNPFANLNLSRTLKPQGAAFETGVRYQAPTAIETLTAASSNSPNSPTAPDTAPEVPKDDSFISRELKNVKSGFGNFMDGARQKAKNYQQKQQKAGDKGRDAKFLNQARMYEQKRREQEEREARQAR